MNKWSKEQEAIFKHRGKNLIINADAGSGKSTVLFELIRRLDKPSLMLSFNRDIAEENRNRAKKLGIKRLEVSTFHSWAYKFFPKNKRKGIDILKVRKYVERKLGKSKEANELTYILSHLRQMGVMPNTLSTALETVNLNFREETKKLIKKDLPVYQKHLENLLKARGKIDFDDMCLMPIYFNWIKKCQPYVFVDELQDLNKSQLDIVRIISKMAKVVVVGDEKQEIYGFRGSHLNFEQIDFLKARKLALSTTYRCRENIVQFVNQQCGSQMKAYKPEGSVEKLRCRSIEESIEESLIFRPQMIVSQKNSVLVKIWVYMYLTNRRSTLKGTPIVKELKSLLNIVKSQDMPSLIKNLTILRDAPYTKIENGQDLAYALLEVIRIMRLRHRFELLTVLNKMQDQTSGIKLETVHSSKGREASVVAVFCSWFNDRYDQLNNVKYVAFTRAINRLIVTKWEN